MRKDSVLLLTDCDYTTFLLISPSEQERLAILGQLETQVWECPSGSSIWCLLFLEASLCNCTIDEDCHFSQTLPECILAPQG